MTECMQKMEGRIRQKTSYEFVKRIEACLMCCLLRSSQASLDNDSSIIITVLPDISKSVVTMPGDRLCIPILVMPDIFSSACTSQHSPITTIWNTVQTSWWTGLLASTQVGPWLRLQAQHCCPGLWKALMFASQQELLDEVTLVA